MSIPRSEKDWSNFKCKNRSKNNILELIPFRDKIKNGIFVKNGKPIRKSMKSSDPNWAIIDPLLGRTEDEYIAEFFVIPTDIVTMRREILHIQPYGQFNWSLIDPLLKFGTDEEVSRLFDGNISKEIISARRDYLNRNKIVRKTTDKISVS